MIEMKSNLEMTGKGNELFFQCILNDGSARIEAKAAGRGTEAAGWSLAAYFQGDEWKRLVVPVGCKYRLVASGGARVWQVS